MGNPNRLISLLPPKVREAVQAEMDFEAVADLFGLTKEEPEMEAKTPKITKAAAREIWKSACKSMAVLTPFEIYERLIHVLKKLSNDVGEDGEPLGQFLTDKSSGNVEGNDSRSEIGRRQIQIGSIKGLEINKEAGEVILTGELARRTLFHVVEEKRAEAAHAISKTIALFNVYWTGKGNEERSRAAEKVEEVKRLLNDLVSLADLARELRSSAQFGGTCDEAKEGCPHCPEASQSSQKPRDLQKDTDQGLTDRRS